MPENRVPLPTISRKAGAIPSSLTFSAAASSGVGTLSGTPVAGNGGVYAFKFRAANGVPPSRNQSFTLTINEAPRFTSFASLSCASNTACNFTITTAGYPTNTNVALTSGTLPSGMAFTNNGNGTATLSGMPATAVGVVPLVFTATNSAGSATQNFTLTVNNYLAITSAATATCTAGSTCTFSVSARGTNTFALNGEVVHVALTSGALPSGLTFVDNNVCNSVADGPCNDTGTLSGTAAAGTGGVYQLQFTATDGSNDADAVQGFTLTVNEAPSFVSPDNITCIEVTANCDFDVSARGYPLPVLTQSGTLPSLLDGLAGTNTTYSIFGVADAGTAGNYPLVFTASNGVGPAITQNFSLTVVTAANAGVVNTTLRGAGTGRVVSNPSGIDCPGSCSKTVAIGTPFHTWQVVAQGKTPAAHKAMVQASKAMASLAISALTLACAAEPAATRSCGRSPGARDSKCVPGGQPRRSALTSGSPGTGGAASPGTHTPGKLLMWQS